MSTTRVTRETPGSSWRWLLPLLLALLIIAIVLGVTLGPKVFSASKATPTPTATPRTVVITATPTPGGPTATSGGPTATPGGTAPGAPTATPSGSKGIATPLPNASPVPTVVGLKLGEITTPQHVLSQVQAGADAGNPAYTYYLDPRQVVLKNLGHYGFTGQFSIVRPANAVPTPTPFTSVDNRPVVYFIVSYQGVNYQVRVAQPGRHGPKGIWEIVTILRQGQY